MATQVLLQMSTSSAYNPKTRERLTPIEAIDGPMMRPPGARHITMNQNAECWSRRPPA